GIAMARPERRVLVFDGDGNVLMNLGTLATIAVAAPANLLHVCFDNGVHASTGGQPTISDRVHLEAVARAAGYRWPRRDAGRPSRDGAGVSGTRGAGLPARSHRARSARAAGTAHSLHPGRDDGS